MQSTISCVCIVLSSSPASNILIKTTCQCSEVLYCSCQHKFIVQLGDFDSSATVPGYQLHLEEHQMIRYASVLPLGTMGYRAPEVSSHLLNILTCNCYSNSILAGFNAPGTIWSI